MECVDVMLPLLVSALDPPDYNSSDEPINRSLKRSEKSLSILSDILPNWIIFTRSIDLN